MIIKDKINVKIKGEKWEIKFVDIINQNGEILGLTDSENNIIYIKKNNERRMKATIVHELCHSILYESGIPEWKDEDSIFICERLCLSVLKCYDEIKKVLCE